MNQTRSLEKKKEHLKCQESTKLDWFTDSSLASLALALLIITPTLQGRRSSSLLLQLTNPISLACLLASQQHLSSACAGGLLILLVLLDRCVRQTAQWYHRPHRAATKVNEPLAAWTLSFMLVTSTASSVSPPLSSSQWVLMLILEDSNRKVCSHGGWTQQFTAKSKGFQGKIKVEALHPGQYQGNEPVITHVVTSIG